MDEIEEILLPRGERDRQWGMRNMRGLLAGGALSLLFWAGVVLVVWVA
jgi:hypothetical protein